MKPYTDAACDPPVRGFLHEPAGPPAGTLVLTHGAGSDCRAPLLVALAEEFARTGFTVLRCDLPFRQQRPHGPPFPAGAARDREGLRNAVRSVGADFLGGHSYGGRQASMLCAEDPGLVSGLLLLSYPLHPPKQPEKSRTAHLPNLRTPALFVHGTRDGFGSIPEIRQALALIPARVELLEIAAAGHELGRKGIAATIVAAFRALTTIR